MHEYEYEVDDESDETSLFDTTTTTTTESKPGHIDHRGGDSGGSSKGERPPAAATTRIKKIKRTYLLDVNPHHGALTKGNGANVIDARWIDMSNGMFIDITGLREREPERSPGVWSCKNNHRYLTAELWPLRRTEFEGTEAWIPYAFDKVLTDEYGAKSLVTEEWAG
ncbi:hypothetical protein F4801DRAFT_527620 [Xylaria longipes]|nr:hypothetical protein F4801DRAFT_527620 [Xylaria longipes]